MHLLTVALHVLLARRGLSLAPNLEGVSILLPALDRGLIRLDVVDTRELLELAHHVVELGVGHVGSDVDLDRLVKGIVPSS